MVQGSNCKRLGITGPQPKHCQTHKVRVLILSVVTLSWSLNSHELTMNRKQRIKMANDLQCLSDTIFGFVSFANK
jgi:hypothetical protein